MVYPDRISGQWTWPCERGLVSVQSALKTSWGKSLHHLNETTKNNQGRQNFRNEIINSTTERFWKRNNFPLAITTIYRKKGILNFYKAGKTAAITQQQRYARSNGRRRQLGNNDSQLLVPNLPSFSKKWLNYSFAVFASWKTDDWPFSPVIWTTSLEKNSSEVEILKKKHRLRKKAFHSSN